MLGLSSDWRRDRRSGELNIKGQSIGRPEVFWARAIIFTRSLFFVEIKRASAFFFPSEQARSLSILDGYPALRIRSVRALFR